MTEPLPKLPNPNDRKCYREAMGLTRRQAGDQIGISARTLLRWEQGQPPNPGNHRRYAALLNEWKKKLHIA
jgi:transcriptional regulator with XRE-family HTH domain